ncbi:hypothetical protein [Microbacterium marmarense]|uniref:Uncharacterized protein n=1 Tax=Microbacterium marmarense TaxID=3122051 RepID=A0ABU8LTG3_9MICO
MQDSDPESVKSARRPQGGIAARASVVAIAIAVVFGLLVLAAPAFMHLLPQRVQIALGGTIDTNPGTPAELLAQTGLNNTGSVKVTHEDVDAEYVTAATIWPWALPPEWGFPESRGVADTPGQHYLGMGVRAAFSLWAVASLEAVETGNLSDEEVNTLLDEVQDAAQTLLDAEVLSDGSFIAESITPLRP